MRTNAFDIVKLFESEIANYTGSPYAIATSSCSMSLLLCCAYLKVSEVTIPTNTYVSVPNSIIHAGGTVQFEDIKWRGIYQLKPYPIYDSAKRLTKEMFIPNSFMCLSFHGKKQLNIGSGGMILTDNQEAADWFKKARWDGREEGVSLNEQIFDMIGWNCFMTPEVAARGLSLMMFYPDFVEDMPEEDYGDLSNSKIFMEPL